MTQAAPGTHAGQAPEARHRPHRLRHRQLFFLAGDSRHPAQEWVRRGLKREPKTCVPLNKLLAEYNFMASHIEEFTSDQARDFLELDRKISPTVRGKVTEKAWARFVTKPLELRRHKPAVTCPGPCSW